MALCFYRELFTLDPTTGGEFITICFPSLDHSIKEELGKEVTMEEMRRALQDMGSYIAPDPDGFQTLFFKKTWLTTGADVHGFVKKAIAEWGWSQKKLQRPCLF